MLSDSDAFAMHPCFDPNARHLYGRIHLPVAPKCNVQCNYCNRKFDCASESRPGVSSAVLKPFQAVAYLEAALAIQPNIAVVGIAGPGDPFANPTETMETLRLVREKYPNILLCVSSNGLGIGPYIDELAALDVSHVTLTINAIDPEIGANVYAWLREDKVVHRGVEAAALLLEKQMEALKALKKHGITVKINSIIVPGVNDRHIPEVARVTAELGADIMNCVPLMPVEGTPFGALSEPDGGTIARVRIQSRQYIHQMAHCTRCRADAAGMLGEAQSPEFDGMLREYSLLGELDGSSRPYVAAASHEGLLVNQHLGEAETFLIFDDVDGKYACIERRKAPPKGGGEQRWRDMAALLSDCRAVLVSAVGSVPREILGQAGVQVLDMSGMIQDGLDVFFRKEDPRALKRHSGKACPGGGAGGGCD
ncbi:MAG TPA: radical SAM protein [Capsulimonadaceae bacterium]|jgi:nitrogen fixation protein NifB